MALYILTFNDNFATRDRIIAHLNTKPDIVSDWYYCLTNAIFIVSSLDLVQLRDFLLQFSKEGRFFISEIKTPTYEGWLPKDAWKFITKYI